MQTKVTLTLAPCGQAFTASINDQHRTITLPADENLATALALILRPRPGRRSTIATEASPTQAQIDAWRRTAPQLAEWRELSDRLNLRDEDIAI